MTPAPTDKKQPYPASAENKFAGNPASKPSYEELVAALEDAWESVNAWGAYASDYFQQKHDLEGDLNSIRAVIDKAKAASS